MSRAFCRIALGSIILLLPILLANRAAADGPATPDSPTDVVVDQQSEKIIQGALKYLASKQSTGGSWSSYWNPGAMTGYTLIAFLSAGQLPEEGDYGKNVARGMRYLMDCVGPDGYLSDGTGSTMYCHGIGCVALAEIYGQTHSESIRPLLKRAIGLIPRCQNAKGGWRYPPRVGDADISVTVLQLVALRAAKNAGIDVPQETIDRAIGFIKSCREPASGGFNYQPGHADPGFARTAAAIYSLQVCGQYDDPSIKPASAYLFKSLPNAKWFTYGNFYAAPAQYMIGGETWKRWYATISAQLKSRVHTSPDGMCFWPPDKNRPDLDNEIFCTAVYTTILAIPYHYLPLYQR